MKDPVTFYPGESGRGTGVSVLKNKASRRAFIKGVIASGAIAGSSTFLFGGLGGCSSDQPAAGAVERLLSLNVNGRVRRVDVLPNETLAMTLPMKMTAAAANIQIRSQDAPSRILCPHTSDL